MGVFQKESVSSSLAISASSFRMLISEAPGPWPLSRLEVWRRGGCSARDMVPLHVFKPWTECLWALACYLRASMVAVRVVWLCEEGRDRADESSI